MTHPAPDPRSANPLLATADAVVRELIEVRGLSHKDAVAEARRLAGNAAAPYYQAADRIEGWLLDIETREKAGA